MMSALMSRQVPASIFGCQKQQGCSCWKQLRSCCTYVTHITAFALIDISHLCLRSLHQYLSDMMSSDAATTPCGMLEVMAHTLAQLL